MGNCCSGANDEKHVTMHDVQDTKRTKTRKSKGKGTALAENEGFAEFKEEVSKGMDLYTDVDKFESDDEDDEEDFDSDIITLERKGKTKELFKKKFLSNVVKHCSAKVKEQFDELGPFKYR